MLEQRYYYRISQDGLTYEFVSVGPRGAIVKVVKYESISVPGYYNLGFGDKDLDSSEVNDLAISDNGDTAKVLATVAHTLYTFFAEYPKATVVATGSSEARNRLYRIGISSILSKAEEDFLIEGLTLSGWEPFRKEVYYHAFKVQLKH